MLAWILAVTTLSLAPQTAADRGPQVENLRFLDRQGALTFAADAPLPARRTGSLEMELRFRVTARDRWGRFASTPLRVAWATDSGSWRELGWPTAGPFARVEPASGAGSATLRLPLRAGDDDALPLLAPGTTVLRLAVAPIARPLLDDAGRPAAETLRVSVDLGAEAPDVSVESPFYGDTQLDGVAADYYLRLREPAAFPREFDLDVEPREAAALSSRHLVVPPGRDAVPFQVTGSADASFRVRVTELGEEVARSEPRWVLAAPRAGGLIEFGEEDRDNAVQAVMTAKNLLKRCQPAVVFNSSQGPAQVCGPCRRNGTLMPCKAESGNPVGVAYPGKCAFGMDECYTYAAIHEASAYTYAAKTLIECGQVVLTPFGGGVNVTYYKTCCTYTPTGGSGHIIVTDCY